MGVYYSFEKLGYKKKKFSKRKTARKLSLRDPLGQPLPTGELTATLPTNAT